MNNYAGARFWLVGLGLCGVIACKAKSDGQSKGVERDSVIEGAAATADRKQPSKQKAQKAKPPSRAEAAEEAKALVTAWHQAQARFDFDAYKKLYNATYFKGVKRTTRGTVARLDHATWLVDRQAMFAKKPEVAVEIHGVKTWLDPGSKLKRGVSQVRFTQRWRTEKYADHGIKIMHLWRNPGGQSTIVYEDLVNAEPGWDKGKPAPQAKASLGAVKTLAQAEAAWGKLAPTGANYETVLGSIPEAVAPILAEALLATEDFDCKQITTDSQCDQEYAEWNPIDDKATFASPCLKRRMAEWAIDAASEQALVRQLEALSILIKSPATEDKIVGAILAAVPKGDAALVTLLPLIPSEYAESSLAELTNTGLIDVYRDGVHAAIELLAGNPILNRQIVLEALGNSELSREQKRALLDVAILLTGKDVVKALTGIAEDDDCELAMTAIEELSDRGVKRLLPKRTKDATGDGSRVLCLLAHAADTAYAEKTLRSYLDNDIGVRVESRQESDWDPPQQDTINIAASDFTFEDFPEPFIDGTDSAESEYQDWSVNFATAPDGGQYIESIDTERWEGCGC